MSVPTEPKGVLIDKAALAPPVGVADLIADHGAVLVVAPHPDDETLGCGAALMAVLSTGRTVIVALLTDGEASHPGSRRYPPDALASLRRQEFDAACELFRRAGGRLVCHRSALSDRQVPSCGADAERVAARIAGLCREFDVGTVWSSWRHDPHCDHEAAASIADRVAARLCVGRDPIKRNDYVVWGRFGDAGRHVRAEAIRPFITEPFATTKAAAMARYRSQLTPLIDDDADGFVMPPLLVEHFAAHPEIFIAETCSR